MQRKRKSVSLCPFKDEIYVCDERDDSIEVYNTTTDVFRLLEIYANFLTSKILIVHNESVVLFEHTYTLNKKQATLRTTGMYLKNGHMFNMDQIIIHWNDFVPLTKDNTFYTCEDGLVWKHNLDIGRSKQLFTFQNL